MTKTVHWYKVYVLLWFKFHQNQTSDKRLIIKLLLAKPLVLIVLGLTQYFFYTTHFPYLLDVKLLEVEVFDHPASA